MTSGFYGPEDFGSSPFDDFLARIYGARGPRQPGHRVDITRLMSAPARELLGAAAAHVAERGGANLDTEQLLWAAARLEPTRELLARAGALPDELTREIESQEAQAGQAGEPPQLTPGAKRALLDAHQISRAVGSTYIGPEHILFALAANPESGAGRLLSAARVTPETLQRVLAGQGGPPGAGGRAARAAGRPRRRWTSSAATSRPWPARAGSTRSSGATMRSSRPSRCCPAGARTTRS